MSTATPAASSTGEIRLVSQSVVVIADQTVTFSFDITGLPGDATIQLTVKPRVGIGGFDAALAGTFDKEVLGRFPLEPVALDTLARSAPNIVQMAMATTSGRSDQIVQLIEPGIYPVQVEVRSETQLLSHLDTFVARVAQPLARQKRLAVALVLPIDGPPTLQPTGSVTVGASAIGRLDDVATGLDAEHDVPVTIVPRPELLEGIATSAEGTALLGRLAGALDGRELLAEPYVQLDAASAFAGDLSGEFRALLRIGEDTLTNRFPRNIPDRSSWFESGLDERALTSLRDLGVRHVVVPETDLQLAPDSGPLTGTVDLPAGSGTAAVPAAVVSREWNVWFRPHDDAVLAANQLVARLVLLQQSRADFASGGIGIVMAPTLAQRVDPQFLSAFLAAMRSNPVLDPVTVDDWFRRVGHATVDGRPIVTTLAPTTPFDLGAYSSQLFLTRDELADFASMRTDPTNVQASNPTLLLAASSTAITADQRAAYLAAARLPYVGLDAAVLPIANQSVTLAGHNTEIPFTITSSALYPIRVKVRIDNAKLSIENNDQVVTVDGTWQGRLKVSRVKDGRYPVTVQLLTPTGDKPLQYAVLDVRAVGLSGLGIGLSFGAALVLITWWAHHLRASRRRKRTALDAAVERHPTTTSGSSG